MVARDVVGDVIVASRVFPAIGGKRNVGVREVSPIGEGVGLCHVGGRGGEEGVEVVEG